MALEPNPCKYPKLCVPQKPLKHIMWALVKKRARLNSVEEKESCVGRISRPQKTPICGLNKGG